MTRFGGTNGTQWFNDVWAYDPKQVAWSQLDCIGYIPAPREGHSSALVGDVMYVFGGRTEEGTDLGDLAAFRITSRRWYTFQNMGPSPSPRSGHSMTAFGKQIVVLAGEPSSAPRDVGELSLVYVLNTDKIRYPNDAQIQQTPSGERVPGNRRPSQERGMTPQNRMINAPNGAPDGLSRKFSGSRESMAGPGRGTGMGPGPGPGPGPSPGPGPTTAGRGQDMNMGSGPLQQGPGSRLPRASMAQAPAGPPPQQQAPRPNGVMSPANGPMNGPRSRTPTGRDGRGYGPPVDTGRSESFEKENITPPIVSPIESGPRQGPGARAMSPVVNGRRTPTQQPIQQPLQRGMQQPQRFPNQYQDEDEPQRYDPAMSRSRQAPQEATLEEIDQFPAVGTQQPSRPYNTQYGAVNDPRNNKPQREENALPRQQYEQLQNQHQGLQTQLEGLKGQHEGLQTEHGDLKQELEAAKSRNAWYASELALAKKAGYQPNSSQSPVLDERAAQSFDDHDKPLVEALVAMRTQLAEVQDSISARENAAAQEVAEVEAQRDTAVREAAYAKAKLAAHGGSRTETPLSESMSRDLPDNERSNDISRKLAAALATQRELRATIASMTDEIQNERQTRELAESTADAANKRTAEFEQSRDPAEVEILRSELHQSGRTAREEAAAKHEAHTRAQLLSAEKGDLERRLEEALENAKQHSVTFASLRDALSSSAEKTSVLERKLGEERRQRETLDQKLLQLRAEHEERTAELEDTTRRLKDSEEMANSHAAEAKTHRQAVAAGLEKLSTRSIDKNEKLEDERVPILKEQFESAQLMVRKNQAAADDATEKLRRAEERIAGLEAYQEQSSREGLTARKQLQDAVREHQTLQGKHATVQKQLETEKRNANALLVQHTTLKGLLDERGISSQGRSRDLDSPGSRLGSPDDSRMKELEQRLEASEQAHKETKSSLETRELEADKTYREKLELLEHDYQAAVHYVKGTEKMLKRMKDELTKYKKEKEDLRRELDFERSRSAEPGAASEWEQERQKLHHEIEEIQRNVKASHSQLEDQMAQVQTELRTTQRERDEHRNANQQIQNQLQQTSQQARTELEQLKSENSMLESRAQDAEQKVTLLLDQVGTSVGNYRRQSQQLNGHNIHSSSGAGGHNRAISNISTTSTSAPSIRGLHSHTGSSDPSALPPGGNEDPNARNSLALDSLASELETLRSHWADTHRTYRLSNQFDFEGGNSGAGARSGSGGAGGGISDSLANWRKRLDAEEAMKAGAGGHTASSSTDSAEQPTGLKIRPTSTMPGGLGVSSDEEEEEEEAVARETGGKRGSKSYVI